MKKILILLCMLWIGGCASTSSNIPQDTLLADEGYIEMNKGNYERAEAIFNVALSINARNPYALLNLGVLYQNTGRLEEARRTYRRLIELNSTSIAVQSTSKQHEGKKIVDIAKANLSALGSPR